MKKISIRIQYWLIVLIKRLFLGRSQMTEQEAQKKFQIILKQLRAIFYNILIGRKGTYCHYLWDSAFVDQYGNVFNCCYSRPFAVGNLNKQDMTTIWKKSWRLKLARWLSLNKALYCSFNCDLISLEDKNRQVRPPRATHPDTVRVLHGELCNLACVMCWQNHTDRRIIPNELLKQQVDWLKVNEIELQGGEVLAMKPAKEFFLWLTQENHKKVSLISNGILINDEWAHHIVTGSDWIAISVNAATQEIHERINVRSKFQRVTGNIRRLVTLKNELQTDLKIIYKFTITTENIHEIADAIPVAAALGCCKIAYGYDLAVPDYLKQKPELRNRLRQQLAEQIRANPGIEVELIRLEYLELV